MPWQTPSGILHPFDLILGGNQKLTNADEGASQLPSINVWTLFTEQPSSVCNDRKHEHWAGSPTGRSAVTFMWRSQRRGGGECSTDKEGELVHNIMPIIQPQSIHIFPKSNHSLPKKVVFVPLSSMPRFWEHYWLQRSLLSFFSACQCAIRPVWIEADQCEEHRGLLRGFPLNTLTMQRSNDSKLMTQTGDSKVAADSRGTDSTSYSDAER